MNTKNKIVIEADASLLKYFRPEKYSDLIRLGVTNDGGYIIPKSSIRTLNQYVNLGVGTEFSFERHLQKVNNKVRVTSIDDTVSLSYLCKWSIRGIIKLILTRLTPTQLVNRFITTYNFFSFYKLNNRNIFVKKKVNASNIDNILQVLDKNSGLKIDIEGGEYEILSSLKPYFNKLNFLVIEFHDIQKHEKEIVDFIKNIKKYMKIAHLHANNSTSNFSLFPRVIEVTFVKNDGIKRSKIDSLPNIRLDFPNNDSNKDYYLNFK